MGKLLIWTRLREEISQNRPALANIMEIALI